MQMIMPLEEDLVAQSPALNISQRRKTSVPVQSPMLFSNARTTKFENMTP